MDVTGKIVRAPEYIFGIHLVMKINSDAGFLSTNSNCEFDYWDRNYILSQYKSLIVDNKTLFRKSKRTGPLRNELRWIPSHPKA